MREYLDKVIKANQCAQYVVDIGVAANTAEQLLINQLLLVAEQTKDGTLVQFKAKIQK